MKRFFSFNLILLICILLSACGKSEATKNVEVMIESIGVVTLDSTSAVLEAEEAYYNLTTEEKEKVDNYEELVNARETLEKLKLVGEWIYISDNSQHSVTFSNDNTWEDSTGDSGIWSVVENGLKLDNSAHEWVYEEVNSVPRLSQTIDNLHRVLIKIEYASATEHEINIDNWQEYFDYRHTFYPVYDPFGGLQKFAYYHWLDLKPKYAERLVYETSGEYTIAVELSATDSHAYGSLDLETGIFTIDYVSESYNPSDTPMGIMHDWEISSYYLGNIYDSEYSHYGDPMNIWWENGSLEEDGEEILGYLMDPEIKRIQGSILLYEYPVHQLTLDYVNDHEQIDNNNIVFSHNNSISENIITGVVSIGKEDAVLYIRLGPTTDSKTIGRYNEGEKIVIYEQTDGWGRTDKGWVMMKYIKVNN